MPGIDPEEIYHNDFHLYVLALRRLALEPDAQCRAEGDYNVARELQYEIVIGRCLIGKGKLNAVEEKRIGDLAAAADALPKDALPLCEWSCAKRRGNAASSLGTSTNRGEHSDSVTRA
jgi:hypothetical protein